MSTPYSGSDPAGEQLPALSFADDGGTVTGTPVITVTETGDGTTAEVISGQALAQEAAPPEQLLAAGSADGKDPREALLQ